MRAKTAMVLLAAFAVATAPIFGPRAEARGKDKINSGYCLSGKMVKDVKKCKENGGRK
jgi:hypothetical protein